MSSFWGFLTEGILLLVLALWWMVNTCCELIKSKHEGRQFKPKITYTWPGSTFPVEIFYKLLITLTAFFGEIIYAEGRFYDEEGNFKSMLELMYISVYGIFLLHSIIDLLLWLGCPLIKGSNYASAATGFFWYALALYYRAEELKEAPVAMMLRLLPVYTLSPISAAFVLESLWRTGAGTQLTRAYCLQTYATWCWHCAFILHVHNEFPGSAPNQAWILTDHRNIAFTAAAFGFHLCLNLVFAALTYVITAIVMRLRCGIKVNNLAVDYKYEVLATSDNATHESQSSQKVEVRLLSGRALVS